MVLFYCFFCFILCLILHHTSCPHISYIPLLFCLALISFTCYLLFIQFLDKYLLLCLCQFIITFLVLLWFHRLFASPLSVLPGGSGLCMRLRGRLLFSVLSFRPPSCQSTWGPGVFLSLAVCHVSSWILLFLYFLYLPFFTSSNFFSVHFPEFIYSASMSFAPSSLTFDFTFICYIPVWGCGNNWKRKSWRNRNEVIT